MRDLYWPNFVGKGETGEGKGFLRCMGEALVAPLMTPLVYSGTAGARVEYHKDGRLKRGSTFVKHVKTFFASIAASIVGLVVGIVHTVHYVGKAFVELVSGRL